MSGSWTNSNIINESNLLQPVLNAASSYYGVPEPLLGAQLMQESSFNPNAQNGNALGIAQFMPGTAAQYGVNPLDPVSSIWGAAQYDSNLFQQTGSWVGALQGYGSLPSSGPLSSGQQGLLSVAQGYDSQIPGLSSLTGGSGSLGSLGSSSGLLGGSGGSSSLGAWLTEILTRGALVALGAVLVIGGIYLLGMEHERGGARFVPVPV